MVFILKLLKWYAWFLLLVEFNIAVLTQANLPVRSTQLLPEEKFKNLACNGQEEKGVLLHSTSFGNCINMKSQVLEIFGALHFQEGCSI